MAVLAGVRYIEIAEKLIQQGFCCTAFDLELQYGFINLAQVQKGSFALEETPDLELDLGYPELHDRHDEIIIIF